MGSFQNTRTFFRSQVAVIETIFSKSAPYKPLRYPTIMNDFSGDEDRSFWQALSLVGFGLLQERTEGQTASIDAASEGLFSMFPVLHDGSTLHR